MEPSDEPYTEQIPELGGIARLVFAVDECSVLKQSPVSAGCKPANTLLQSTAS